jgi:hypothetical protein
VNMRACKSTTYDTTHFALRIFSAAVCVTKEYAYKINVHTSCNLLKKGHTIILNVKCLIGTVLNYNKSYLFELIVKLGNFRVSKTV